MNRHPLLTQSTLTALAALLSSSVSASGFQLNEFSAIGLGRAYSGESAIADSAASGSRNPASMTRFTRPAFSAGIVFIDPTIDIRGTSPSGKSLDASDIAPSALVPNLHYLHPLDPQWTVGGSITSNFGLSTEFSPQYPAGPYAGKTKLTTVNFNLSTAYRLNQQFSVGLGVNAVNADATLERYIGENGAALNMPVDTQISRLKGNDWGYGWNAGVLYELDDNNRYGLSYRSAITITFNGDYSSQLPSALNPARPVTGLPLATDGKVVPGTLDLNLPDMWEVSGYNRVSAQWAMHYSMAYNRWSHFEELRATGKDGNVQFLKYKGYRDAYNLALGGSYYHDESWTFRTGITFDQNPVPVKNRSISIPDQNRIWLSAGMSYAFNPSASLDVGITYMHGQSVTIKEGPYHFDSTGKAWLYGAGFNYQF
ncbi:long-chain fatty acid transporter FadL [Serratia microhaemolytica]|uniref:long-chain fatty acid transporter FadL n=1 Tax=Serratia microhaemolytica TaxID=2675110 RepID=UPI000FDF0F4C|nr:long-chain fatty acid transporter FadL [Serratia microhaemolytica]